MQETIIAAAQITVKRGAVSENIESHLQLIAKAAEQKAQVIVFPELSLTGYEPDLAAELAFTAQDPRLAPLHEAAQRYEMTIIVGAPLRLEDKQCIAAWILQADGTSSIYTKHHLHAGEERYFSPASLNPMFTLHQERAALAICADTTHPEHAAHAAAQQASLYLAGVLITPQGYAADATQLQGYAQQYKMLVVLANFGGASGGHESAGKSAIWSPQGNCLAMLKDQGDGLVIATKKKESWTASIFQ